MFMFTSWGPPSVAAGCSFDSLSDLAPYVRVVSTQARLPLLVIDGSILTEISCGLRAYVDRLLVIYGYVLTGCLRFQGADTIDSWAGSIEQGFSEFTRAVGEDFRCISGVSNKKL